jgi:transposase-like protein
MGSLPERPYKSEEFEEARRLRTQGESIKRIARALGVSPGTVHRWTIDIELTAEHKTALDHRQAEGRRSAHRKWSARCRERRRRWQEIGRAQARLRDPLHTAGCMLYWAGGAKSRNALKFANSDPAMLVMYARFLRESLSVVDERMAVRLNFYTGNGLTQDEIEDYWLDLLALPRSCLRQPTVNHFPTSSSGKRRNKLPYGVCTITVGSTELTQHVFGAIQEYSGIDNLAWLD